MNSVSYEESLSPVDKGVTGEEANKEVEPGVEDGDEDVDTAEGSEDDIPEVEADDAKVEGEEVEEEILPDPDDAETEEEGEGDKGGGAAGMLQNSDTVILPVLILHRRSHLQDSFRIQFCWRSP
jgi:hypothetical protein